MNKQSNSSSPSKKLIEICLISARGLPRPTLFKHQWYAIGWINQSDKYCTKIDASGNPNPVWKTKFTTTVNDITLETDSRDVVLNVEVYSREPVFLREKLQGTASINLKEFLVKCSRNNEDLGSFQLRKKNGKPLGFIDVSVKVSEEEKEGIRSCFFLGDDEGFNLQDNNGVTLATGPMQAYTGGKAEPPFHMSGNPPLPTAHPYAHPIPYPRNYSHPSIGMPSYPPATGPSYPPPRMPPPPPPPPQPQPQSNFGYAPSFLPHANTSYTNMPSSSGGGRGGGGPGFGVGLGAGALAAGAVIFGEDLMSGFELPTVMSNPNLTMSIDPPF